MYVDCNLNCTVIGISSSSAVGSPRIKRLWFRDLANLSTSTVTALMTIETIADGGSSQARARLHATAQVLYQDTYLS